MLEKSKFPEFFNWVTFSYSLTITNLIDWKINILKSLSSSNQNSIGLPKDFKTSALKRGYASAFVGHEKHGVNE